MVYRKMVVPFLAAAMLVMVGAVGCEKQGPAEEAGEKLDNALQDGKDGAKDVGEKMGDALEDAGDKMEDAAH